MAPDLLTESERDAVTPARLPDRYELVDGQVVEMTEMSALSVETANLVNESLIVYLHRNSIGRSRMEASFPLVLADQSTRSRRPDVAYVSFERWPKDRAIPARGNDWPVVPELAVEVVSPNDPGEDIEEKMAEYFEAGVAQVWVIYPRRGIVVLFESLTRDRRLTRADRIEGISFLPGYSIAVTDILPPL
jgi:Uma2 family endonuclease